MKMNLSSVRKEGGALLPNVVFNCIFFFFLNINLKWCVLLRGISKSVKTTDLNSEINTVYQYVFQNSWQYNGFPVLRQPQDMSRTLGEERFSFTSLALYVLN